MGRQNWQLLDVSEIVAHILSMGKDDAAYRQQKCYYKRTGNTIMLSRFADAERVIAWEGKQ